MTPSSTPVVLITGAARRIGAGIARHLHARGLNLMLHYRQSAAEASMAISRPNDSMRTEKIS